MVNVGFASGVNIDDCEHEDLATDAALSDRLERFEYPWDCGSVNECSIEVDSSGEGDPDVVILADGSVIPFGEYSDENTQTSA